MENQNGNEAGEILKLGLYESQLYGSEEETEAVTKLVLFCLDQEWYGINVDHVQLVEASFTISVLPFVPDHIKGVVHLRGSIVSVTDLKTIFGLASERREEEQLILVIEHGGVTTGLLVDAPVNFAEIPESALSSGAAAGEGEKSRYVVAHAEWNHQLVAILDAKKLIEKTRLA